MSPEVSIADTVGNGPQPDADLAFSPVLTSRVADYHAGARSYAGRA